MNQFLESCAVAFSMYSAIPVPHVTWNQKNMKYALCFFPLIGVCIGAVLWLWLWLSRFLNFGGALFAAVAVLLPVAISGGIHLDGYCDTLDGLGSHQSMERKLEILKDSHVGAFALIGCGLYLLADFGLWAEFYARDRWMLVAGAGFVLSRALSGLGVARLRCAKNSGLVHAFADAAGKNRVSVVMGLYIAVCAAVMLLADPVVGGCTLAAAGLTFLCYRSMAYRQFGGITGDLAGWFLQLCEAFMLLALLIAAAITT